MDKRIALVTLWAAFAVAAVGVGFGAAGLVGGPFSDGVADAASAGQSQLPTSTSTSTAGTPAPSPSSSPAASTGSASPGTTEDPGPVSTREATRTGDSATSTRPVPARSVTRSITTRGGLVSASCRSDLAQVSGSPALGWEIEDIDGEARRVSLVRFERPDADGRVEVEATCARGAPRFSLDDDGGDDDDDDDSSSGGGDERESGEDQD
ncbi:MAG: hypothetical protein LH461_03435 [Spirochaetaceae bacterium]|nr:hypothetical protein [Spirochaetaceae bacterium]